MGLKPCCKPIANQKCYVYNLKHKAKSEKPQDIELTFAIKNQLVNAIAKLV